MDARIRGRGENQARSSIELLKEGILFKADGTAAEKSSA
jgi:hypothetical protein